MRVPSRLVSPVVRLVVDRLDSLLKPVEEETGLSFSSGVAATDPLGGFEDPIKTVDFKYTPRPDCIPVIAFVDTSVEVPPIETNLPALSMAGGDRMLVIGKCFDQETTFDIEKPQGSGDTGEPTDEERIRIDRLMAFPTEFRKLGSPLHRLLDHVFASSSFNDPHFLRGVYFTSGVQKGQPVLGACASLLGDQSGRLHEEDVGALGKEQKAYFIADLYERKVFQEAGLVQLTRRSYRSAMK